MHSQSRMKSLELSANYNIMPVRYQTLSKSALAAAVAAACVSFPAWAEEDPVDLGAVTITATDISTRTERNSTYKSSAMSTTTGLALSPRETPQSVSNVTMTRIEDEGITDMSEAMRKTTGITVIQNSGTTRFLSRGFYVDQIQEDGVSSTVSGGASGNPYRDAQSLTDLAIYDHIEVVRGPTGLTQSNGEPGGTINAVRKRPTADFQASASAEVGSWDTYRTVGDISGSLNEAQTLRGYGFQDVRVLREEGVEFEGVRLYRTECEHGAGDLVTSDAYDAAGVAADACGVVFEATERARKPETFRFYLAGDTVFCEYVEEALAKFEPAVIAVNAAGAQFPKGHLLIMNEYDVLTLMRRHPDVTVIATHLDGVSHATVSSDSLRTFARENGLEKLHIPAQGETIGIAA